MLPKRGDLAVCSLGFVGVIDCDEPQPVTYPDGNTGTAWTGKVLMPEDRMGAPWSSRNPILIAYVIDDGTYAAQDKVTDIDALKTPADPQPECGIDESNEQPVIPPFEGDPDDVAFRGQVPGWCEQPREFKPSPNPFKRQEGGDHYSELPEEYQPVNVINGLGLAWCEGNALKYILRHRRKNGAQDVRKAIHYLEMLLATEYSD